MKSSLLRPLAIGLLAGAVFAFSTGCGGDGDKGGGIEPADGGGDPNAGGAASDTEGLIAKYREHLELPTVRYEFDPQAGDKSVSAEDGGPGFTGEGWTTNLEFPAVGMPGAPKGGSLKSYVPDWPATLRLAGENWNSTFNYMVYQLCQETLTGTHPTTLETIPGLATHWKISEDKGTYTYRINPAARFSDGTEVTANDVVASWKFITDEGLNFPSTVHTYGKFHEPVAKSKYIVEVKVKTENWRNFMYFGGLRVFPAKEVSIGGAAYLKKYQNDYTAMSGPYTVNPNEIEKGKSLTIRRRDDWWDKDNPAWSGMFNIDTYIFEVVKDPSLAFEKVKKGDLDYYVVPKAQWWAEEVPKLESVQRGLLQPLKLYTDAPLGSGGIAINMKHPPLDDVRIRKALQYLHNRELMIEKLFFNEYEPYTSYYQGGTYANPDNEFIGYDPVAAVELLEAAGWTDKNDQLIRVKDGRTLKFELTYASPLSERGLTIFKEDCKAAGIEIELKLLDVAARWKSATSKQFQLTSQAWGGLTFPNPETSFHSRLSEKPGNNNITGLANPRVDEICDEYDKEYDQTKRRELIRELDGIVYAEHPYVLEWYNPAQRVLVWNKFGMPPWGCGRVNDRDDMHFCWWVDPAREKALEAARKDPNATMEPHEEKNRFWQAWTAWQRQQSESGK